MLVHLITGTRPNLVKAVPVFKALTHIKKATFSLIHTGQHFDHSMKEVFFKDLDISDSVIQLDGRGLSHASQTASIMCKYENYIINQTPNLIIVFGDVDSTLACSLVASKMNIPIAHVESGLRSFDRTMPEEINRVLTDQLAQLLFTTSPEAEENLLKEGKCQDQIFFVGNTMIDCLEFFKNKFDKSKIIKKLNVQTSYALMTFHRPSNVNNAQNLYSLVNSIIALSKVIVSIFPVHPRTRKLLNSLSLTQKLKDENNIILTEPLGYIDFMRLQKKASVIITDSGGIQEESTYFGIPCLTVRDSTERPITVTNGTNKIIGTSYSNIVDEVELVLGKQYIGKRKIPDLWDGNSSERISNILFDYINKEKL